MKTAEDLIEATNLTFDDWEVIKKLMIDFANFHVIAVVTKLTEMEYDRSSEKIIKQFVKERLNNFYPLNTIK